MIRTDDVIGTIGLADGGGGWDQRRSDVNLKES
jgi:hypothetical protein